MGLIRKTASIGTVGLINFRSTKERLQREQLASERTREALTKAEAQVEDLRAKAESADDRATRAELDLLASEKRARRRRRWAQRRQGMKGAADDAANLGRRARRKLRKEAKKAEKAGKAARRVKDKVTESVT